MRGSGAQDQYIRQAELVRVIDGDTFVADVDLGFMVHVRFSCRVLGINALELAEPGGMEARERLLSLLSSGIIVVKSVKLDKYAGRFDALVQVGGSEVADVMVHEGFAVYWDGKGPKPKVPWPRKE